MKGFTAMRLWVVLAALLLAGAVSSVDSSKKSSILGEKLGSETHKRRLKNAIANRRRVADGTPRDDVDDSLDRHRRRRDRRVIEEEEGQQGERPLSLSSSTQSTRSAYTVVTSGERTSDSAESHGGRGSEPIMAGKRRGRGNENAGGGGDTWTANNKNALRGGSDTTAANSEPVVVGTAMASGSESSSATKENANHDHTAVAAAAKEANPAEPVLVGSVSSGSTPEVENAPRRKNAPPHRVKNDEEDPTTPPPAVNEEAPAVNEEAPATTNNRAPHKPAKESTTIMEEEESRHALLPLAIATAMRSGKPLRTSSKGDRSSSSSSVSSPQSDVIGFCGDGFLDAGEECDFGIDNGYGFCTLECKFMGVRPDCGNGIVDEGEECDEGPWNGHGSCTLDCLFCDHFFHAEETNIEYSYYADLYRNDTRFCSDDDLPVYLWLGTDEWSDSETAVYMFDVYSYDFDFIWAEPAGAFKKLEYYNWATCVPASGCYEFYVYDGASDGFSSAFSNFTGFYFEANYTALFDIYPGDQGVYFMYEEFWGVRFGNCSELGEGYLDEPDERLFPYDYVEPVIPAPFYMDDRDACVDVFMYLETDACSFENEVYLLYPNELKFLDDGDAFIWDYEVGSFMFGNYTWFTCVDPNKCTEFYYMDTFGDGFNSGGLYLEVDGKQELLIEPGSEGSVFFDEDDGITYQYWSARFGPCQDEDDLSVLSHGQHNEE